MEQRWLVDGWVSECQGGQSLGGRLCNCELRHMDVQTMHAEDGWHGPATGGFEFEMEGAGGREIVCRGCDRGKAKEGEAQDCSAPSRRRS